MLVDLYKRGFTGSYMYVEVFLVVREWTKDKIKLHLGTYQFTNLCLPR